MTAYRWARRADVLGQSVHAIAEGAITLSTGIVYPPLLPDLSAEAAAAAAEAPPEVMQYGPLMGLDDLRAAICGHVAEDGVLCAPENVLVTNGAKQALELALRVFVEPGDRVIVTAPTYLTALQIMRAHTVSFVVLPQDQDGPDTDHLEHVLARLATNGEPAPKLFFDMPDFHNPTGITTSLARRQHLIELAERHGFVILEDEPYRRLRFDGTDIAPLAALDDRGVVVSLGTVSKILAPGLRVGWAIGPSQIIQRMALQKADGGSSPFTQRIVAKLMRANRLGQIIDETTACLRRHRDAMVEGLATHLPEARFQVPQGGYFIWVELPPGISAGALARRALEHGVEVGSGRLCFPEDDPDRFLRFCYSPVGPDKIADGLRRLGQAFRAERAARETLA